MNAWRERSLCRRFPALPWIEEPCRRTAGTVRAMTVVCLVCPVKAECASYAERYRITSGFWSGNERPLRSLEGGDTP